MASGVALGYLAFSLLSGSKKSSFLGFAKRKKRASGSPVYLSGGTQLACNCGQTMGSSMDITSETTSQQIQDFRNKCHNGSFCAGASGVVSVINPRGRQIR
jgi:hypothetical protein